MNYNVTIRFTIKNVIDEDDLYIRYNNNYRKAVEDCIKDNGLFGVVDDDFRIIDIEHGDN